MAASDFRSRNNRSSTTTTTSQKYQTRKASDPINWNQGSDYLDQRGMKETSSGMKHNWSKADNPMESGGKTYDLVNNVALYNRKRLDEQTFETVNSYAPGQVYAKNEGTSNGITSLDTVGAENITKTKHSSSTSYKAGDGRDKDDGESSDSEKANRKKKGRSGLRIKRKADASAGRLKGQDARVKKKSGAQGGGPTGLNIPR